MNTQTPPEKMTLEDTKADLRITIIHDDSKLNEWEKKAVASALSHLEGAQADKARLDFLDSHLVHLSHVRSTSSVHMCGTTIHGQVLNDRSQGGGTFRKIKGRSIRHALDSVINPQEEVEATGFRG